MIAMIDLRHAILLHCNKEAQSANLTQVQENILTVCSMCTPCVVAVCVYVCVRVYVNVRVRVHG